MTRARLAVQNLFDQVGYLADPTIANAAAADWRLSFVRLGAGGATGGAATWNQVDTTNPLDPFYPAQQSHDNIARAVALGIPMVVVNVSPYRRSDLDVTLTTLAAPGINDTTLLIPVANAGALPLNRLAQIDSEQMLVTGRPDGFHVTVAARGANDTTPDAHVAGTPMTGETTTARYPVDEAAYILWLQTSVAPLANRTDIEVLFQILNEPQNTDFWQDTRENYARLVVTTATALYGSGPAGLRLLLAGMTPSYLTDVLDAIALATGNPPTDYFDILDFHPFGIPDMAVNGGGLTTYWDLPDALAPFRAAQTASGIALVPVWFTEVAVPDDTPTDITGTPYPGTPYTEEQQARDTPKRLVYPLASQDSAPAVDYTEWAYLPDTTATPSPPANTYFEHVGARGVTPFPKKLAYWAVQQAADFLVRVGALATGTPVAVSLPSEFPWVRVLTAPDANGRTATVVWYDFFRSGTPQTGVTVTLQVAADATQVAVKPWVANKANGTLVVPSDFDPTYYAASGGRVSVPIDRNPWTVEVSATTAAAVTPYGPTKHAHVRALQRRAA